MLNRHISKARCLLVVSIINVLLLTACNSPEESAENHLQKGKELFDKGEYDKAILELKTSSQSSDKRSDTYYYMALLDEKTNNFKSMRENLQKTIELDPNNIEARQKFGKVNLLFGDLDKAMEQANFILQSNSGNEEAKLLKASIYVRQQKINQATEIIDSVIAGNPENIDALSLKAALLFEENKIEQALNLADTALTKDVKNIPIRLFKIKINAKLNKIDSVISDYQKLIELYPETSNFKLTLASIYSMTDKLVLAEELLRDMMVKSQGKIEPKIVLLEFLNAKQKDKIKPEFNAMLADSKNDAASKLELSKWMLVSGYPDDAANGLNQVVDVEGNSEIGLTAQAILAETFLNNKEYDKVEKSVSDILSVNSDFIQASLLKARLFMIQNKVDEAVDILNKAIWTKNNSDNAYALLGQAYSIKRDQKQADKNFKQALEINPANMQAFMPIYNVYLQANQKEVAREYLGKALKAKPNNPILLTNKVSLDISEKRWDDAQETVQRLALFSKNKAIPTYLEANILQGKEQYSDAIKIYEDLLKEFPDHLNSLVNLVRSFEALKQRDKALIFLETHYNQHKNNLVIAGVLSDLYMSNNDFVKAKQILTGLIQHEPEKSAPVYLALAKVEVVAQKNINAAKDIYIKGLKENPDNEQLSLALASLYERQGAKQDARKVYEHIIEINSEALVAVNNLATLLVQSSDQNDIVKGLKLAERFKDADNVSLKDTYAWALIRNEKIKEGLSILEGLIVREPKMPELRYHLGSAHFKNGNKATAIVELKQAIALSDKQKNNFLGKDEAVQLLKELENK